MFSLDVFSTFLGQLRTECKFSGGGGASGGDSIRTYPQKGGGGVYIYIRNRNGGGGGQVISIEMYLANGI